MPNEPQLIKCDGCGAHISLRGDSVVYQSAPKNRQNLSQSQGALIEGNCPKCDHPFEIWYAANLTATHVIDLEIDRPEVFAGDGRERVNRLAKARAEQARAQEEAQRRSQERRAAKEQARREADERREEERRLQAEARRAQRASSDDGDWDDDRDGGRSSNDDRSDSMNPNNDAYRGR